MKGIITVCLLCLAPQLAVAETYTGHYTENQHLNPEDPTPGFLHLTLPKGNGPFSGQFLFSYVGCLGNTNVGTIKGIKTNSKLLGNWSGIVDGKQIGGRFDGISTSSGYQGTWRNTGGKLKISIGSGSGRCQYHVAPLGRWIISTKTVKKPGMTREGRGRFSWLALPGAVAWQIIVYDERCLKQKADFRQCLMWYDNRASTRLIYGQGAFHARPLIKGRRYIISVMSMSPSRGVLGTSQLAFTW